MFVFHAGNGFAQCDYPDDYEVIIDRFELVSARWIRSVCKQLLVSTRARYVNIRYRWKIWLGLESFSVSESHLDTRLQACAQRVL